MWYWNIFLCNVQFIYTQIYEEKTISVIRNLLKTDKAVLYEFLP